MTTLNQELYDALKAAGAPEDKARAAAEVPAGIIQKLKQHDFMLAGLYIAGAAGFGYVVSLLNTIIGKL